MNIEQERNEFEAWYRLHHGSRDVYERDASGEYTDKQVQGVFNVWQARAALTVQLMPASIKETIIKALIFRHDAGEDQDACDNALNWLSQHAAPVAALEEAMLKARVEMRHCRTTQSVDADAHLISACDPDTIRALLDERDALAAEVASYECAVRETKENGNPEQPAAVGGAARRRDVRLWMRHNAGRYSTATELAEAADEVFNLPDGGLDNETHWVWDEAAEAAAEAVDDYQRGGLA